MAKSKKVAQDVVLVVRAQKPDGFGTNWVEAYAGVIDRSELQSSYQGFEDQGVRTPETVAGIYTDHGKLEWRFYRKNRGGGTDYERSRTPEDLRAPGSRHGEFYNVYNVDWRNVDLIAKALRTVEKKLTAQYEKYGHTDDFAEGLLRVAAVFGATRLAIEWELYTEATGETKPEHARGEKYNLVDVKWGRDPLNAIGKVDTVKRCHCGKAVRRDDTDRCHDHREPLVNVASDALALQ